MVRRNSVSVCCGSTTEVKLLIRPVAALHSEPVVDFALNLVLVSGAKRPQGVIRQK